MLKTAGRVTEVGVAAPAVAQVVLAGVVAGVGDSHQETSCQIGR